eukprot:1816196-Rhodomonas_salina.1
MHATDGAGNFDGEEPEEDDNVFKHPPAHLTRTSAARAGGTHTIGGTASSACRRAGQYGHVETIPSSARAAYEACSASSCSASIAGRSSYASDAHTVSTVTAEWNLHRYFKISYASAHTLADIGVTTTATAAVSATLTRAWANLLPTQVLLTQSTPPAEQECLLTHEPGRVVPGPFDNDEDNRVWAAEVAADSDVSCDLLGNIDALEPDPATIQKAFKHPCLKPFWKH